MRSTSPMPGNPWPHDMVLSVEDAPHALHQLLWIREAWDLHPADDDLPPLLTRTPERRHDPSAPVAEWERAWPDLWRRNVAHAGRHRDRSVVGRPVDETLAADERRALLGDLRGPTWADHFGDDALGDPYRDWEQAEFEDVARRRPTRLADEPERLALDALVPAWRAGLDRLVLLPCEGMHTRRIGPTVLLLTERTRDDTDAFRAALRWFVDAR